MCGGFSFGVSSLSGMIFAVLFDILLFLLWLVVAVCVDGSGW